MVRQEIVEKYFINVELSIDYLDLYHVRSSILSALRRDLHLFHGTVLDVGCGIMPYRELIQNSNKKITQYIGLDFENSIDPEYALAKPDLFWKGDRIPLEDGSVNTIIATEFFEHCPEPERIMKEMLRVLQPKGVLFLTVPFIWNLHIVPNDEYRYTPYSLERHLINAGFKDVKLMPLGGWDASLAQMLALYHRQRRMRPLYKKIMGYLLKPVIRKLVNSDRKGKDANPFRNGAMISGLSGTAFKKTVPEK